MNSQWDTSNYKNDPKKIGPWKIGRTIGKGSSGRVRIARHSKTGQHAAVKIMSKTTLNSQVSLDRLADEMERRQLALEREIVVMKLIDHPNIMQLYDVWETSTELFLILEYIQGGELFEYLCKKGRLPISEALCYFQQIVSAVDYCHQFHIAHRDLKPENILLDLNHNIKIADFGMAAWQNNARGGMLTTSCGSPHYAAPEIINGTPYNGSTADIWSCGIILYALLSGKLPFDDEDCPALLNKVMVGVYDMPQEIDPLAQDLIKNMLITDPATRITMAEIQMHPFYLLQQPNVPRRSLPILRDIAQPIQSPELIDPHIFANLRTLWHGSSDREILASLLNDEQNWQKGIYHLLIDYRMNNRSNGAKDLDSIPLTRKHKTLHSIDAKAALPLRPDDPSTIVSYLPDDMPIINAPYPEFASFGNCILTSRPEDGERDIAPRKPKSFNRRNLERFQIRGDTSCHNKENAEEEKPDAFARSTVQDYHQLQEFQVTELKRPDQPRRTKPSARTRCDCPSLQEYNKQPLSSAKPRPFQAKQNWLTNIFRFRTTDYPLLSMQDLRTTWYECRRLILETGAQIMDQDPGLGTLKCRFDKNQPGGTRRTTKFRLELQSLAEVGYRVLVVRGKGSQQLFKEVFEQLQDNWTLS